MDSSSWFVYLLRCADGTLYTGITTDVERRLAEHNGERAGGGRYTRARRPVTLVFKESFPSRSDASRREVEIRRSTREQKLELIASTRC